MLVLQRKVGESIVIADDIIVTLVECRNSGKVRIGVTAPDDVPVHRMEVYEEIHGKKPDNYQPYEG